MNTVHSASSLLARARISFACRLVDKTQLSDTLTRPDRLSHGQLALVEIRTREPHVDVVLADGNTHRLRPNTPLLVVLGENRSAVGRSGVLPETFGPCDLLTPHGLAGVETTRGTKLDAPAQLHLLGLPLKHDGSVATLADFAEPTRGLHDVPRTFLLVGSAHRVGETEALLNWTEGLCAQELQNDFAVILLGDWPVRNLPSNLFDAGASHVLDASNLGLSHTTDLSGPALLAALDDLRTLAGLRGARHCLVAIGGGVNRPEFQRLLATGELPNRIAGVVLLAADALSARTAALELKEKGLPLLGLSGPLASSPLAIRESQPLDTPIYATETLADPTVLTYMCALQHAEGRGQFASLYNPFN